MRAVIGAAETASFDTVGETIRTNYYESTDSSVRLCNPVAALT